MAFTCLKLVWEPLPPASGREKVLQMKPALISTPLRALPLQVKSEYKAKSQSAKASGLSRRDVINSLTAICLSGLSILSVEPVEARVRKPEIRKKIMEKLEKLRQQGEEVSKPKAENGNNTTTQQPSAKENQLSPSPFRSPVGPQVEAIILP